MARRKIVVHSLDGRMLRGYSYDFSPQKPTFHLLPAAPGSSFGNETIPVRLKELKAIFFVRDFGVHPRGEEQQDVTGAEWPPGQRVEVTFTDGQVLVGSTVSKQPRRSGFFVIPRDSTGNELTVFVVAEAVAKVRFLS